MGARSSATQIRKPAGQTLNEIEENIAIRDSKVASDARVGGYPPRAGKPDGPLPTTGIYCDLFGTRNGGARRLGAHSSVFSSGTAGNEMISGFID